LVSGSRGEGALDNVTNARLRIIFDIHLMYI
jgi:hypothetical protein